MTLFGHQIHTHIHRSMKSSLLIQVPLCPASLFTSQEKTIIELFFRANSKIKHVCDNHKIGSLGINLHIFIYIYKTFIKTLYITLSNIYKALPKTLFSVFFNVLLRYFSYNTMRDVLLVAFLTEKETEAQKVTFGKQRWDLSPSTLL